MDTQRSEKPILTGGRIIYSARILRTQNLGDHVCSPLSYIDFGQPVRHIDLRDWHPDRHKGPVIFGGGGLLHDAIDLVLEFASQQKSTNCVFWGAGLNYHTEKEANPTTYQKWMSGFDAVGVRDVMGESIRFLTVPCPSCLHPEFLVKRPDPVFDFIIYQHYQHPIEFPDGELPRLSNNQPPHNFWRVLDFLASGETVITNTYHGAYWAQLLGRKCICWKPFSNRFNFTPWKMPFCKEDNWWGMAREATVEPNFLETCRKANLDFAEKVRELIK